MDAVASPSVPVLIPARGQKMDPKSLQALAEREALGEDVLTDKRTLVDYDRRRQGNREAITKLRKGSEDSGRVWMRLGDIFVKLPKETVSAVITSEQENIEAEMEKTRKQMKEKVSKLEAMEGLGTTRIAGFDLKPVDQRLLLRGHGGSAR